MTLPTFNVLGAKSCPKQAGLCKITRRGYFTITDQGKAVLRHSSAQINTNYLEQFAQLKNFRAGIKRAEKKNEDLIPQTDPTPDEILRKAHDKIVTYVSAELLDRVCNLCPNFFERLIADLLLSMGYGGSSKDAGITLGLNGDNGVDGVIKQDLLGVDQIYIQAERYADANHVGRAAIHDFFGAISLKKAQKGRVVTTSSLTTSAKQTAQNLGGQIVLIDGVQLAKPMIKHNVGCRIENTLYLKKSTKIF